MDNEFLEIVGNGKPTGSALKQRIAVSATIPISVQNRHSRTVLQDLLRSRVWKMHQEPEVLEVEAQVGKLFDCRARLTSNKLAPKDSLKNGILQSACSTRQNVDANVGISALTRIKRSRKLDGMESSKSKRNAHYMLDVMRDTHTT